MAITINHSPVVLHSTTQAMVNITSLISWLMNLKENCVMFKHQMGR